MCSSLRLLAFSALFVVVFSTDVAEVGEAVAVENDEAPVVDDNQIAQVVSSVDPQYKDTVKQVLDIMTRPESGSFAEAAELYDTLPESVQKTISDVTSNL